MHIDYLLSIRLKVNNREEKHHNVRQQTSDSISYKTRSYFKSNQEKKKKKKRAANYNTPLTIGYK